MDFFGSVMVSIYQCCYIITMETSSVVFIESLVYMFVLFGKVQLYI